MKKYILKLSIFLLIFSNPATRCESAELYQDFGETYEQDSDDLDFGYDSDAMEKAICSQNFQPNITYCEVLNLIIDTAFEQGIDVLAILSLNLYLRTNKITKRDINTLPIFTLYHNHKTNYCQFFNLSLFFNETMNQYFFRNDPAIKAYIAVDDPDILNELAKLDNIKPLHIPDILALFKDAHLEERRTGLMFQYLKNWNKTAFEFQIPLLYQERNFNFTEQELEDIKSSNLFPSSTSGQAISESEIRKYAVADLFGIGDLNCKLSHLFINQPNRKLRAGFELSIPTAFAFKKGLIGSNFSDKCCRPPFSIYNAANLWSSEDPEAQECLQAEMLALAFDAYERMAAAILQTELGQNKHWRIGLTLEPEIRISEMMRLNSLLILSYSLPTTETLYYLKKKNCADFDRAKYLADVATCTSSTPPTPNSETTAKNDLTFLSQQVINTFFPTCAHTEVDPKFMLQFNLASTVNYKDVEVVTGLDFWWQSQIDIAPRGINTSDYYIDKAVTCGASQTKFFMMINKLFQRCRYDFQLALNGDYTFTSTNIGKDFSLSLAFKFNY